MIGACLIVGGVVAATLPGEVFTVAWRHSVEKTRWEERYRVDARTLRLVEASVEGLGAGMEPPPDAVERGGRWTWHPARSLDELRLTYSSFTSDYELCASSRCAPLHEWTGALRDGDVVTVRACG